MRVLFVEIENGSHTRLKGRRKGTVHSETVPRQEVIRVEIPDNAIVTLQGLNPINSHKGSGNPVMLRIYGPNKKQLGAIPNVLAFREDVVKISRLVEKPNVVGKSWEDVVDGAMFGEEIVWQRVHEDEEELVEF